MTDGHDLFIAVVSAEIRLYGAVERRLRAETSLAVTQYEILRLIGSRTRCRVGDVSSELLITVGAASKAVDRLEAEGWVRRRPNPDNRRSSLLELTHTAHPLLAQATECVEAELSDRFAALDPDEREQLTGLLRRLDNLGARSI